MPGPPRKPTHQLKMSGSWRADYARGDEPQPETGAPPPPERLCDEARKVWFEIVPLLDSMGVLAKCDGVILARYCELSVDWWKANEWIREKGTTYPLRDKHGNIRCFMQFPQVGVRNHVGAEIRRIETEFGLTPAARTKIDLSVIKGKKTETDSGSKRGRFFSAG